MLPHQMQGSFLQAYDTNHFRLASTRHKHFKTGAYAASWGFIHQ